MKSYSVEINYSKKYKVKSDPIITGEVMKCKCCQTVVGV